MSRDEDLLGSPAGSAMPLVISRVLCSQKIGWHPCSCGRSVGRLGGMCVGCLRNAMTRCRVRRPRGFCGAGFGWRAVQQYTTSGLSYSGGKEDSRCIDAINGVIEKIFAMVTLCLTTQSYRPAYSLQGLSNVDRSHQPTRKATGQPAAN
jgi:hypothetical protein